MNRGVIINNLYLDTEFNGFGGKLISLALVSTCGAEWYRVYNIPYSPHDWVKENVLPRLNRPVSEPRVFRESLWQFLRLHEDKTIIADWPADFEHLMSVLYDKSGVRPVLELNFKLLNRSGDLISHTPHNALSDARALMFWHHAK